MLATVARESAPAVFRMPTSWRVFWKRSLPGNGFFVTCYGEVGLLMLWPAMGKPGPRVKFDQGVLMPPGPADAPWSC